MHRLSCIVLLMHVSLMIHAQAVWELKKDKNGIRIYTAKQSNSNYKCLKVECLMEAKFSQIIAVLFDIDKHYEWVYNTKSSEICRKVSDSELIYHSQVNAPWPFSNRDLIAHLKVKERSPQMLTIESHAEPAYMPCKKNCIRIRASDSYWTITAVNNNSIKVEYVIQFDPGGTVPAWLINMFVTDGPYETFKKLKERVHSPDYRNVHYSFIRE